MSRGDEDPVRVLVLEDDGPLLDAVAEALEHYGYRAESASSVEEAAGIAGDTEVDAVVGGAHLVDDAASFLAAVGLTATGPPVILLSSDQRPQTRRRALDAGAAEFLYTPISGRQLAAAIEAARARRPQNDDAPRGGTR